MAPTGSLHETLVRDESVTHGSDRSFGFVFAAFFGVVVALGWHRVHRLNRWALGLSAAFLLLALVAPVVLSPLNWVWARFGLLLHKITSPIILGLMYAFAIVPVGLLMRWRGHDPMQRAFDPSCSSYWIARTPPGPSPESMTRQY